VSEPIGEHTHVFTAPVIRSDVAPVVLAERFGWFWWFSTCETCAEARLCPSSGDLLIIRPEVPLDWRQWREHPERYEIPAFCRA